MAVAEKCFWELGLRVNRPQTRQSPEEGNRKRGLENMLTETR